MSTPRPAVSVVLPFAGDQEAAEHALTSLRQIDLRPGDEVIVVDNSGQEGVVPDQPGMRIVRAWREASSYYARNEGTAAAQNPWLLFLDSDCQPPADLIARYFAAPIAEDVGAVIGEVTGDPTQESLVSRYARSRGHLGQEGNWQSPFRPWGVTANMLVRRDAWSSVGGFQEGIRSAGDTEFSWRLQDAGWRLDYRPEASVAHEHRDSIRRLARQAARYGAGRAWVMRRYPSSFPTPPLVRQLTRAVAGVVVWTATGHVERAAFKALDGLYVASEWASFWLMPNRGQARDEIRPARIGLVAGSFPALDSDDGTEDELRHAHIEASARPVRVNRELARSLTIRYLEDDGGLDRALSLAWLLLRAPAAVLRATLRAPRPMLGVAPAAMRMSQARVAAVRPLHSGEEDTAALLAELVRAVSR